MATRLWACGVLAGGLLAGCQQRTAPASTPPGAETTAKTDVLKAGAAAIQGEGPLGGFDVHLSGFHPMKAAPERQMAAHHFCRQVNEDFAQCVLFDGDTSSANMTGVEYIVSARLFETLPATERAYWHPHNGEILSGQLIAPGLPAPAELELMRGKINSYGKTWHTWPSAEGGALPTGPAMLAWSFNRDGEARPGLVEARDRALGVSTAEARRSRQELVALARPQDGVDALKGAFGRPTQDIPGVTAK